MTAAQAIIEAVRDNGGETSNAAVKRVVCRDKHDYAETTVDDKLGDLVNSGDLIRTKQGWYDLPERVRGDGTRRKPVPQEQETGEEEVRAYVFGEANAAGELVLGPQDHDHPKTRAVSPAKWRADFGESVPYGASSHGYWLVRGDSAAPIFFEGEEVPVRKIGPTQEFEPEGVYIFRWNGDLYLKRLFRTDEGVYAQSLNPAVRDMRFRPGNGHDFAVLAKVRSSMKQQLLVSLLGDKLQPNR